MSKRGEVLVAILNNILDFEIARDQGWYRIPVSSQRKWLRDRWPPHWLAFYQTKVFGPEEAHRVNYYAPVLSIRQVVRAQLFSHDPNDAKGRQRYYQLRIGPLQRLAAPIRSPRWRRIVFIPTTWDKLITASEVNDLFDDSPLEDQLWAAFKQRDIAAVRQFFLRVDASPPTSLKDGRHQGPPSRDVSSETGQRIRERTGRYYTLDFAIFCASGNIDVETDGDTWHANPERAAEDNYRDNELETRGWSVLRFNTKQIREQTESYCLPKVVENIDRLGGLDEGRPVPRHIDLDSLRGYHQPGLFNGAGAKET
jgi:hypothetical protein